VPKNRRVFFCRRPFCRIGLMSGSSLAAQRRRYALDAYPISVLASRPEVRVLFDDGTRLMTVTPRGGRLMFALSDDARVIPRAAEFVAGTSRNRLRVCCFCPRAGTIRQGRARCAAALSSSASARQTFAVTDSRGLLGMSLPIYLRRYS